MNLINSIKNNISNLPGWSTNRKIIVIESDDWGSIRMPSRSVYNKLLDAGLNLNGGDGLRYSLYDSLEAQSDLELLFEVLDSCRDFNNASAVFTAISVVANPDFEKIRESDYQEYYYEPFTETLKKYNSREITYELWKEGISNHIFIPQFHGREHLNVPAWMRALRENDYETKLAFNMGMWSFVPKSSNLNGIEYEAAFQMSEVSDLEIHKKILMDGLNLFEEVFGYKAEYFVPPNGHINNKLNLICWEKGIKYRSVSKIQKEVVGYGQTRKKIHWLGQKETNGIRYITRNCFFEPSQQGIDWIDSCLNGIKTAFRWNKPAIISTHRVNYIGIHDPLNRGNGLKELKQLLKTIKRYWGNVEFLTTDQLGSLINNENNY